MSRVSTGLLDAHVERVLGERRRQAHVTADALQSNSSILNGVKLNEG